MPHEYGTIPSPYEARHGKYKRLADTYGVWYVWAVNSLCSQMIPGLNTNITYAGGEYHVQTEDLGRQNPYVLTLVFRAGAIIAREKVNYQEFLGDAVPEVQIKRLMDQQHQRIIKIIQGGQLRASAPPKPSFPPADKSLDQLIDEYLRSRHPTKPR